MSTKFLQIESKYEKWQLKKLMNFLNNLHLYNKQNLILLVGNSMTQV